MRELEPKQKAFVREYVKDHNGTQAAIRAGYSKKTACVQASDLLLKPEIKAMVQQFDVKAETKSLATREWIESRFIEISERCMQKVPVMFYDRETKEMVQRTELNAATGKEEGVWEFDSSGANKALENLCRMKGLFLDKIEHAGKIDISAIAAYVAESAKERGLPE